MEEILKESTLEGNCLPDSVEIVQAELPHGIHSAKVPVDMDHEKIDGAVESAKEERKLEGSVSIFRLFAFADALDYLLMLIGFAGAAGHGCALPVYIFFFGKLLDGFGANVNNPAKTAEVVGHYSLYLLYLGIVVCFASWAEVAAWMQTGERQAARMRVRYLQAVLKQDVTFFDSDAARTGDVVSVISSDTLLVQDAVSEKMGNFIHYIVTFIAGFAIGFSLLWKLSLVTLAVVPAIAMAGGFYAYAITNLTSQSQRAYAEAGGIAEQSIAQVRTVYSFVGEQKATEAYSGALHRSLKLGYQSGLAKGVGLGVTSCVMFCCWALLLWYGGVLVRNGNASGGKALSTIFTVVIGGLGLGQAMANLPAFAKAKAAGYKIFVTMDLKPSIDVGVSGAKELDSVQGHIEFRDVQFRYPSRPDVVIFRSLSIDIRASKTVAIVGGSGSGKSTIVSLIERFYDPSGGAVLLDGTDIRTLNRKWLRSQIGLVSQEPALFATSIRENILYGKADASDKEIEDACQSSNAHTFISALPRGYHTQVGERGVQMSGGQKQRIAIARAILKNPAILLLDEATSALDASSEQIVQAALDTVMVGRTTVVVAHRLSTIQKADTIAVVQDGAIVEMGTHATLMEKDGAYSSLVRLQEMALTREGSRALSRGNSQRESERLLASNSGQRLSRQHSSVSDGVCEGSRSPGVDEAVRPQSAKMWRLLKVNRPEWGYGALGSVGSALSGLMFPALALIISNVLYAYYKTDFSQMQKDISKYALILLGLAGVSLIGHFSQNFFFGIMSENLVQRVREMMFARILTSEISWFDKDENSSGQVSARLSADATTVKGAIGDRISSMVQNFTLLVAAFAISFSLQWKMALVVVATFPLVVSATIIEKIFLKGFSGDVAGAQARASMVASEAVGNVRTVAAFNAEDKVVGLFQRELQAPLKRGFLRGQAAGIGFGVSQLCLFGSFALALWYGAQLVKRGEAKFNHVLEVYLVLMVSSYAIAEALGLTPDILKGGQALDSVFRVLDRHTEIDADDPNAEVVGILTGDIEYQDVAFTYPNRPDVQIFRDLNLKVRAGNSLALVGESGSGKSSVISLLERFYDPTSGRILIDGKDIRKMNLNSLRRRIALVSQEPALFATTVYSNVLYGRETATEQEVHAAAMAANAHNFISALPESYNTRVGERGVQLSGGQKQRVAIARAVLKDPAILLLDEATSALDAESERVVQDALERLMQGRTSVIVAHRLSTIRNADSIAVIQDGTVIEEGTHNDLVSRADGAYAGLVSLQQPRWH